MNMVVRFIFSALLVVAMTAGANAQHNFSLTSFTKMSGASSSGVLHGASTRPDSVWYVRQMCNDSNFLGTLYTSSDTILKVGVGSIVDTISTLSDTNICWLRIISYRHDTDSLRSIIRDTTGFVVLNKVPTLSASLTSTSDSIRYSITVNGGNANHVMIVMTPFLDSLHTIWFCPDTFYVSGSNTFMLSGRVRSWLSSCTRYFFEFKVINPISGTIILNTAKNTACPLVSTPYIGVAGTPISTASTITIPVVIDLYSRNATFKLYWRLSSLSSWTDSVSIIGLDTTLTGGQYRNLVVSGLLASTSYTFDVKAKNVVGTSWLGTTVVSTTAPLPVFSLSIGGTYASNHINTSISYSNTPGGHCTFTCGLIHGGSIVSSIPFYSIYSAGVIDTGFSGISDTGFYGVTVWGYDNIGTYIESDTVWFYIPYIPIPVSIPYIGTAGTPTSTVNSITLHLVMDLYSRNASFRLYWRQSSLSSWTDSVDIVGLDTTLTGSQYKNPIVSGLLSSTSYSFDVRAKNVTGTSWLGVTVVSTTALPTDVEMFAEKNVNGRVYIISTVGRFIGSYESSFDERRNIKINLPNPGIYISVFVKENGERLPGEEVFFNK